MVPPWGPLFSCASSKCVWCTCEKAVIGRNMPRWVRKPLRSLLLCPWQKWGWEGGQYISATIKSPATPLWEKRCYQGLVVYLPHSSGVASPLYVQGLCNKPRLHCGMGREPALSVAGQLVFSEVEQRTANTTDNWMCSVLSSLGIMQGGNEQRSLETCKDSVTLVCSLCLQGRCHQICLWRAIKGCTSQQGVGHLLMPQTFLTSGVLRAVDLAAFPRRFQLLVLPPLLVRPKSPICFPSYQLAGAFSPVGSCVSPTPHPPFLLQPALPYLHPTSRVSPRPGWCKVWTLLWWRKYFISQVFFR